MRDWDAQHLARAAAAELLTEPAGVLRTQGPERVSIDSRAVTADELFVGLPGERLDGGSYATEALRRGAWGVLVTPQHAHAAAAAHVGGAVLAHEDPLASLQTLARAWGAELHGHGAEIVGITGSTGKTSTKDILTALLATRTQVAASPQNLNTEIGLPLALLAAPRDTRVVVLEMAMRGPGQIAELVAIAQPDIGVIVNVGPAHLELLGSLEAIAAAKAELIAGLAPGATVVVPAGERLLDPHLREGIRTITFGEGGDVSLTERRVNGEVVIDACGEKIILRPSFTQAHNLRNLLAAVAAAQALGYTPSGALDVSFSAMRGQRLALTGAVVLIDDCYNANPMSMRAAIDDLTDTAPGRRVAVLGDMLELGAESRRLHREIGEYAAAAGIELLLTVGELAGEIARTFTDESHTSVDAREAAALLAGLLRDGDTVLVKGSRGVGLEHVVQSLRAEREVDGELTVEISSLASGAVPGQR
jgi:UDP-N-acetylmuramoyl-tripeptide--D-alanyl-D-alanine ligase